jgi:hypothetical protein
MGSIQRIETTARLVGETTTPALPVGRTNGSYDVTLDLKPVRLVDPGDLETLARAAVVTPSTAAPAAFEVLVDALLERGIIRAPPPKPDPEDLPAVTIELVDGGSVHVAPKPLLEQAWEWATKATTDMLAMFTAALEAEIARIVPRPSDIVTASGVDLDRIAGAIYGLERREATVPEVVYLDHTGASVRVGGSDAEADEELRERCRAVLRRYFA